MSHEHDHIIQIKDLLYHWGAIIPLLAFSATAHAAVQWKDAKESKQEFTWADFLFSSLVAGFSGTMFGLGAAYLLENKIAILWFTGMGAFMGLKGLNTLFDIALDVISRSRK